jgi:hypothetical protein
MMFIFRYCGGAALAPWMAGVQFITVTTMALNRFTSVVYPMRHTEVVLNTFDNVLHICQIWKRSTLVYATYLPWIIALVIPTIVIITQVLDPTNERIPVNAHLYISLPLLTLCIIVSTFLQFKSLHVLYTKRCNRVHQLLSSVKSAQTLHAQHTNYTGVWHTHASKVQQHIQQAKVQNVSKNVETKMFINAFIMVAVMIAKNFVYVAIVFKIQAIPATQLYFYVNDIFSLINPILLVSSSHDVRRMLHCALQCKKYSPF